MATPRPRHASLTGAAAALTLLAVGCGGGAEEPATPSSSEPSAAPSTPGDTASSAGTTGESYLPVPSGITLTQPGSELQLKDSAVAAWEPRQGLVGVVDVTVTRIDKTTVQASLASFDLKGDEQRSTPYFVRAQVGNVGETDLGARQVPLYVVDGRGVLIAPTGVASGFKKCPGSILPAVFAPGDEATTCLIFLAPEGSKPKAVMFRPPEGVVPLQWTADVTPLAKGSAKQGGKAKGGQARSGQKKGGQKKSGQKKSGQ